jgi:hypothetical protein
MLRAWLNFVHNSRKTDFHSCSHTEVPDVIQWMTTSIPLGIEITQSLCPVGQSSACLLPGYVCFWLWPLLLSNWGPNYYIKISSLNVLLHILQKLLFCKTTLFLVLFSAHFLLNASLLWLNFSTPPPDFFPLRDSKEKSLIFQMRQSFQGL